MIKKLFLMIALLLPAAATAQNVLDSWRVHPFYAGANIQKVIDTGDQVYYLSSNCLYCYDKTTQENESLNTSNYLNDVTVTSIYYDTDNKALFVTYDNGNIDLIMVETGKIVPMPDILNAPLHIAKGINHISFDGQYAYVATNFGYVVIEPKRAMVKESRIYNSPLNTTAHVGKWILIAHEGNIYIGDDKSYHESLAQYTNTNIWRTQPYIVTVDNSHFLLTSNSGMELCTIADDGKVTPTSLESTLTTHAHKTKTGFVSSWPKSGYYVTTDASGANAEQHTVDVGELVSIAPTGDGAAWGLNPKNGLHKVGDDANYYKPAAIGIETNAFYTVYNNLEKKLYLTSTADNIVLAEANLGAKTEIWTYDGATWADNTPENVPLYNGGADGYQGNWAPVFVPGKENEYLISTRAAGLLHVIDGKIAANYYFDNMPRDDKYKTSIAFDSKGNLLAVQSYKCPNHPVMVLPAAKLANPTSVTTADWVCPEVPGMNLGAFKRSSFVIAGDDSKVYTTGEYNSVLILWDSKGNSLDTKPAVRTYAEKALDQDGGDYRWEYIRCLTRDPKDNGVWMGTSNGVVKFNPADAFKDNFYVKRFKVPRKDGTSLADYLLDGIAVNCIVPDASGRMWIGTNNNGLFLVSASGTEIIKSFNTDNSPLVSNCIYSVCTNPNNNSVFIMTNKGMMEYFTDVVPASPDYSNVHVFPNPVRPEYGSLVTIAGLMENSLIKIADSAGNVVKQLKSEGGMATWDCCNDSGNKVSSGVYFVIASQNENNHSSSVVSKFVVIK